MKTPFAKTQQSSAFSKMNPWTLFWIWCGLGIQSFGGGSSTLILIQQACSRYGWLSEEEFIRAWGLSQISPGINLAKLTVIIGYRLKGWRGVGICLTGLLLPSATITVLMTAGYTVIQNSALMQAAMRGIMPATIGLSLAMSFQMAQSLMTQAYHEGRARLWVHILLLALSIVLAGINLFSPFVVLIVIGGAATTALMFIPLSTRPVS